MPRKTNDSDIDSIAKEVSRRLSIEDTSSTERKISRTVTYDSDDMSLASVTERNRQQEDTVSVAFTGDRKKTRISFPPSSLYSESDSDDSNDEWLFGSKKIQKGLQKNDTKIESKPSVCVDLDDDDDSSESDVSRTGQRQETVIDLCSP